MRTEMTEAQLQALIIEAAKWMGWMIYHTYDSRRSEPGWPDLILVKGRRLLALEVKTRTGRVSEPQKLWLDAIGQVCDVTAKVVRPADVDEVIAELARNRRS